MLDALVIKKRRDYTVEVALRLGPGEAVGLFGASGTGKSTVLSCLAGIETPDDGYIKLGDLQLFPPSLPLHHRPLGYLTQEPNLFPHLTVKQNVCFGVSGLNHGEQSRWIAELKDRLGLTPFWNASAARVSGGQARRVALARMLVRRPPLVLLDEPFGGLDRQIVRELIGDLLGWSRDLGFSMIAIDHQADILERICPRALVLEKGKVVQEGTWEELHSSPATPLLRSLLEPV
jgi:ABC-type sulfate/molybdate transport systems ATPase subunit